ncbi:type II secretion system protein GspE [Serratia entomophila]|uniref:type II secretion system protein GspE n=1 Tax=Serratia entomophila TaxID=42906 RepID=UPI00217A62F7|nr:type II secretion system protein GspE [Serratia entomophila]CAI0969367.1 Type II traffic warden ATPase [Serratia entomophila]CAI0971318.1 Type II traffic warden ATPase [Serratia entomophila]CAI1771240.1 Type II traffic warden ATPase [Serratia entomophila]CAI1805254.1 Type II traffic warden ATPase [Serratia entomophila]CAI1827974.1 Type II traffic warden ATPase [Serratia entomophila]
MIEAISEEVHNLCRRYQTLALNEDHTTLTVALSEEAPQELLAALRFATGKRIHLEQWPAARLELALNQRYLQAETPPLAAAERAPAAASLDDASDTPVVQFINQTLRMAIQRRASDVHFEPYQQRFRVRLRIDGVLQAIASPPAELAARLSARLKIMGQLDIAERRLPQDGQLSLWLDNARYSMRIATLPTLHGEKVVLRILQTERQELPLEGLGMSRAALGSYAAALASPQGMILVTGPTGSGKTVTLYSGLRQLNDAQSNLCSVEDPIEIPLFGVNQTQVNAKTELSFSKVLRALLRQDPDVIMIGEIRDQETAEIAVKAAQTGHLVLSTLHTNSTGETLTRLTHMGIPGYLIAACLKLVIAQRLVRRLCEHCRYQQSRPTHFPAAIWPEPLTAWRADGCEHCFSGYYGRIGVYELLAVTPEVQAGLLQNATPGQLADIARQQGQITLLQAGLTLVAAGVTSLEELYRVVDITACGGERP